MMRRREFITWRGGVAAGGARAAAAACPADRRAHALGLIFSGLTSSRLCIFPRLAGIGLVRWAQHTHRIPFRCGQHRSSLARIAPSVTRAAVLRSEESPLRGRSQRCRWSEGRGP